MFITLLSTTFAIAFLVSLLMVIVFSRPIGKILSRIISDDISNAWKKYLRFAILVVGISSGVRIWHLEKYITPPMYDDAQIVTLTTERWALEIYRTIIGTLSGIAWMLLVFFIFALIGFIIIKLFEGKQKSSYSGQRRYPDRFSQGSQQQRQKQSDQRETQKPADKSEKSKPLYRTSKKKINL